MTSNLGSDLLLKDPNNKDAVITMVKQSGYFKPEFINRIDEIIVFNTLGKDVQFKIVEKQLKELNTRLANQNIHLTYTDALKDYILQSAYDETYGARPLRRFIQRYVETYVANEIVKGNVEPNFEYVLDYNGRELKLFKDKAI